MGAMPDMVTEPSSGTRSPRMMSAIVDFPAPVVPTSASDVAGGTCSETCSAAGSETSV